MRSTHRSAKALIVCILLLAACGDSNGDSASSPSPSSPNASVPATTATQPKTGGSITMGMYAETNGLDPVVSFATGVIGGTELAALYDTVMRFDPSTGKYSPGTAQSLEPNADFSVW